MIYLRVRLREESGEGKNFMKKERVKCIARKKGDKSTKKYKKCSNDKKVGISEETSTFFTAN